MYIIERLLVEKEKYGLIRGYEEKIEKVFKEKYPNENILFWIYQQG